MKKRIPIAITKAEIAARKSVNRIARGAGSGELFMISSRIRLLSARIISNAPIKKKKVAPQYLHIEIYPPQSSAIWAAGPTLVVVAP